jgi:hypothetical protein
MQSNHALEGGCTSLHPAQLNDCVRPCRWAHSSYCWVQRLLVTSLRVRVKSSAVACSKPAQGQLGASTRRATLHTLCLCTATCGRHGAAGSCRRQAGLGDYHASGRRRAMQCPRSCGAQPGRGGLHLAREARASPVEELAVPLVTVCVLVEAGAVHSALLPLPLGGRQPSTNSHQ